MPRLFQQTDIAHLAFCSWRDAHAFQSCSSTGHQGVQPGNIDSPAGHQSRAACPTMDSMKHQIDHTELVLEDAGQGQWQASRPLAWILRH